MYIYVSMHVYSPLTLGSLLQVGLAVVYIDI